jgi:hypothetical protein
MIKNVRYVFGNFYNYNYIGHLQDDMYTKYEMAWGKENTFTDSDFILNPIDESNILYSNFNPIKPIKVDIKNTGNKIVMNIQNNYGKINTFTTFGNPVDYIMDGKYTDIKDPDINKPFRFVSGDSECFAMLYDAQTKECTFANEKQTIKLNNADDFLVGYENGLYGGRKITNNLTDFTKICEDNPLPAVYCYNFIFFGINDDIEEIEELNAILPNDHTK